MDPFDKDPESTLKRALKSIGSMRGIIKAMEVAVAVAWAWEAECGICG